jgi:hypothetical protein
MIMRKKRLMRKKRHAEVKRRNRATDRLGDQTTRRPHVAPAVIQPTSSSLPS